MDIEVGWGLAEAELCLVLLLLALIVVAWEVRQRLLGRLVEVAHVSPGEVFGEWPALDVGMSLEWTVVEARWRGSWLVVGFMRDAVEQL